MSSRVVSVAIIIAMVGWIFPAFQLFTPTYASQLGSVSATASSSAPSVATNYMVRFTTVNAITSGSTTVVTFDPVGNSFDTSSLASADILLTGFTKVGACTGGPTDEAQVSINPTNVTITVCSGDSIPPGAKMVNFVNNHITNPAATGSYIVRVNGTMTDFGDTRVGIIDRITMSGVIESNLTFSVISVATSSPVNGDMTSTSTTATAIGFGTLSVGTSSIAAQDITVQTNALHGFSVTVTENQDLTSANGANINAFRDGNPAPGGVLAAPAAWGAAPAGTIGSTNTYGHMGITSEDATLPADDYGSQLYAGLTATSTRTILYHDGPADGSTANIGRTRVGYRVQITSLQEAGNDYSNQITYVCTPIF